MAVSSSVGRQFTIDEIVSMAYRKARLAMPREQLSEDLLAAGRDWLETVVDDLVNHGRHARAVRIWPVTMVADQRTYDMPSWLFDIWGDGIWVPADDASTPPAKSFSSNTTLVVQKSRAEFHELGAHGDTGQPYAMWLDRDTVDETGGTVTVPQLYVWPVPTTTQAGGVVQVQAVRQLADCDDGAATLDLESSWRAYIITALAKELAQSGSVPLETVRDLRSEARMRLKEAKGRANESIAGQIHYAHRGGYEGM